MNNSLSLLDKAREYEQQQLTKIPQDERPLFHLTPLTGWMNDPNGFCYYQGQYHMFYQYNPYTTYWNAMHWGHAVSHDLLHWTYLPCALAPDTEADTFGCFSGSATQMPDGRMLLAYTGVQNAGEHFRKLQEQCIAIGDGLNFEKCPQNPVVHFADLPDGYSPYDFRDPKIWTGPDGVYRMVVGSRHRERNGAILFLTSPDEVNWHFVGEVDAGGDEYGFVWECPDFFELDGKQVLIVSPQDMEAREEFHPGHVTAAVLGTFEEAGCHFTRESIQALDLGLDFYAPQTVLTPDGRRVMIGWMNSWDSSRGAPRLHPWYGQLSCPRELFLQDGHLMQRPMQEIETLWQNTIVHEAVTVDRELSFSDLHGRMLDMSVTLHTHDSACQQFTLRIAKDDVHFTEITVDFLHGKLIFDRLHSGTRQDILHRREIITEPHDGKVALRLIMDKESVEIFINNGERVLTAQILTPLQSDGISFAADAPIRMDVTAHALG